jgi:hypothetical protein
MLAQMGAQLLAQVHQRAGGMGAAIGQRLGDVVAQAFEALDDIALQFAGAAQLLGDHVIESGVEALQAPELVVDAGVQADQLFTLAGRQPRPPQQPEHGEQHQAQNE